MNDPSDHANDNVAVAPPSGGNGDIDPLTSMDFLDFEGFHNDAIFLCKLLDATTNNDRVTSTTNNTRFHNDMSLTKLVPPSLRRSSLSLISNKVVQPDEATSSSNTMAIAAAAATVEPIHLDACMHAAPNVPSSIALSSTEAPDMGFPDMNSIKVPVIAITPNSTCSTSTSNIQQQTGQTSHQQQRNFISSYNPDVDDYDNDSAGGKGPTRFTAFHEKRWDERYLELRAYRKEHGHSLVPHTNPSNPQLGRWVKRQRRQYKLMQDGRPSTMTPERALLLEELGFAWDSHQAAWSEKIHDLRRYRAKHGHCLVPSSYKPNPQLATWVKCQRRQYKLYREGKPSAMTPQRIAELEAEGFCWEIRSSSPSSHSHIMSPRSPRNKAVVEGPADSSTVFNALERAVYML